MRIKRQTHMHDRFEIREETSLDIATMISSVATTLDMHDELPDWSPEKVRLLWLANDQREWLLDKASQERFIRSVGILATLDEAKLDELIEAKRETQPAIGT